MDEAVGCGYVNTYMDVCEEEVERATGSARGFSSGTNDNAVAPLARHYRYIGSVPMIGRLRAAPYSNSY